VYGLTAWSATYNTYLKPLKTLQNKAFRMIVYGKWHKSVTPFYHRHHCKGRLATPVRYLYYTKLLSGTFAQY